MSDLFEPHSTIRRAIIDPLDQMPHVKLRTYYRDCDDAYRCEAVDEIGAVVVETQLINTVYGGLPVSYFSDIRRRRENGPRPCGRATYLTAAEFCENRGRAFISDSRLSSSASHVWETLVAAGIAREVAGTHPYRMCFANEVLHREVRGDI